MKKNHLLKLMLIVAFVAFALNEMGSGMHRSIVTGFHRAKEKTDMKHNRDIDILIDGNLLIPQDNHVVKIDSIRELKDVKVAATLSTNDSDVPWDIDLFSFAGAFAVCCLTFGILKRAYKVITAISNNKAFEFSVVRDLKQIGYYFLASFAVSLITEQVINTQFQIMAGPKLHLLNDGELFFGLLVTGLMVLVIAQAFEQGMALKEEQDLTI